MAYLPFNGGAWWSSDGLGNMLTVDFNDENVLKYINPLAFGLRGFSRGPDGKLYSPFGYTGVPMELGERVRSWITFDENGKPTSAIPREIQRQLNSYNDLEKFGFFPVTNIDEIPFYNGNEKAVLDAILDNYHRKLDDRERGALKHGVAGSQDHILDFLLDGILRNGEKRGLVLYPDRMPIHALRSNQAPHIGYSLWGIADPRDAVVPWWDWGTKTVESADGLFGGKGHNYNGANVTDREFLNELVRSGLVSEADAREMGKAIRESPARHKGLGNAALRKVAGEMLEYLSDIIPSEKDREYMLDKIVGSGAAYVPTYDSKLYTPEGSLPLRVENRELIPSFGDISGRLIEPLSRALKKTSPEKMRELWDRFSRGQLIKWIGSVMGSGSKYDDTVLVKVMAPLTGLVPTWGLDRVSAQTDSKNELRALEITPSKIITDSAGFRKDYEKYKELLKKPGMKAADAWAESFGDKYGNLLYLNSDENLKNVYKSMCNEVDDYIRQRSVCNGLKRGPGND